MNARLKHRSNKLSYELAEGGKGGILLNELLTVMTAGTPKSEEN